MSVSRYVSPYVHMSIRLQKVFPMSMTFGV